jgi:ATP-dependent helicase Lhr and Lhr-like helicase
VVDPRIPAYATLAATPTETIDPVQRYDDRQIRLRDNLTPANGGT